MDERFVGYVGAQWADLVGAARQFCPDADTAEAQELVLATLTKVAGRWRFVPDQDDPDLYVRRLLVRACVDRDTSRREEPSVAYQVMEIGVADSDADEIEPPPAADAEPAERQVALSPAEALAILARRVRRLARGRLAAAAAAVALVVGVAVTVAGSGSPTRRPAPNQQAAAVKLVRFPQELTDFAGGVTAGGGYVWTIESRATRQGSRSYVVRRDPVSGRVEGRYTVPEPDDHIAYGLGRAWAWHDNDDFPTTSIATVDEAGGIESSRTTPPIAIQDATFTGNAAWFTEPEVNSVLRFPNGVLGDARLATIDGAKFVVPLGPRSVLVAGRTGTLYELPGHQNLAIEGSPTLLAPAPGYGFWVAHGRSLEYRASVHAAVSLDLTMPLTVGGVIGDPKDGVYVSMLSDDPLDHDPYLVYYSPAALAEPHPQPTAHLDGLAQAEGMTADPAGGIVFVTNEGAVEAWHPTGIPGTGAEGRDRADHAGITSSTRRITPRGGFA